MTRPLVLMLGTADWDQPIPTNQHYMSKAIAEEFDVVFVESIGLRAPEFSRRDLVRIWKRLVRRSGSAADARRARPERLTVVSPLVLPRHTGLARRINRRLLHRALSAWLRHDGPRILWCYSPVDYGLSRFADHAFYHCVDLLGEFPGGIPDDSSIRRSARSRRTGGCARPGAVGSSSSISAIEDSRSRSTGRMSRMWSPSRRSRARCRCRNAPAAPCSPGI